MSCLSITDYIKEYNLVYITAGHRLLVWEYQSLNQWSIYDEIIGQHGDRFDLNGTEQHQIDNLAEKMLHFNSNVDEEAYKEIIAKYAPEKLGRIVRDFILTIQKG